MQQSLFKKKKYIKLPSSGEFYKYLLIEYLETTAKIIHTTLA